MLLHDPKIKSLVPKERAYRIADGDGLYLLVTKSGKKRWVFRYTFAAIERSKSFGSYPEVTLLDARRKRTESRLLLTQNLDPCDEHRKAKIHAKYQAQNSFRSVAKEWYDLHNGSWCDKYRRRIWHNFEKYVFPHFDQQPIATIEPLDILRAMQNIAKESGAYLSKRVLETCKRVFSYGVITGRIKYNPAIDLHSGLPRHRENHHPIIRTSKIPDFLAALNNLECGRVYKLGFKLLLLTALRTHELRHSKWEWIDFTNDEWAVPKEFMKMREPHLVPLSSQAKAALEELRHYTSNSEFLFPNPSTRVHPVISENFATNMIAAMGYKGQITGHGFRSLFSTVANEFEMPGDPIERQLAHRGSNRIRAIYNRAQHLQKRREILGWWGDYLESRGLV